jgi:DNA-directed RNA polymerase subunit M/transcription elongation factor TFIIS
MISDKDIEEIGIKVKKVIEEFNVNKIQVKVMHNEKFLSVEVTATIKKVSCDICNEKTATHSFVAAEDKDGKSVLMYVCDDCWNVNKPIK